MSETLEKPMQLRLPKELRARIARIAEANHLSDSDVARICLAQTVPSIEKNGLTILPASETAAATGRRPKLKAA